jgi:hypothetical protein
MKTVDNVEFVVNHLFLPRQLPQENDVVPEKEQVFTQHVLDSALAFQELGSRQSSTCTEAWNVVTKMLASFVLLHESNLDSSLLEQSIVEMGINGTFSDIIFAECWTASFQM